MKTTHKLPVRYHSEFDKTTICFNDYLGKYLEIHWLGEIFCIGCGRKTNKSFMQGYCYPCMVNSPETAECIIRPELCRAHLGEGRDPQWEIDHHNQPHAVYLAVSSGLKVGITRHTQIPTRWIDQGASRAIILAEVPNRYLSGCIEVALKDHLSDRTQWQRMLKNEIADVDLLSAKKEIESLIPEELSPYLSSSEDVVEFQYPVIDYPTKVTSLNLDKTPDIGGTLTGIKGQYLMFDERYVINMRKYSGYAVTIQV